MENWFQSFEILVILTQVQAALCCTGAEVLAQGIDNLSVTRLDHSGAGWQVVSVNHAP